MSRYISIILGFLLIAILLGYAIASSGTPESGAESGARTAIGQGQARSAIVDRPASAAAPLSETPVRAVSSPEGAQGLASSGESAIASGLASWYPANGLIAAVNSWRFGDTPYRVTVTSGGSSVVVLVSDYCQCGGNRIIDLSDDAFRRLAPLSKGLIQVTVLYGPMPTLPPTDTGGTP